jgi:hypothetical protein
MRSRKLLRRRRNLLLGLSSADFGLRILSYLGQVETHRLKPVLLSAPDFLLSCHLLDHGNS